MIHTVIFFFKYFYSLFPFSEDFLKMSGVDERPANCDFEVIVVENQTDTDNKIQPPDKEETRKQRAVEHRVTHINLSIYLSNSFLDASMTE
jgi:hypothetical protein